MYEGEGKEALTDVSKKQMVEAQSVKGGEKAHSIREVYFILGFLNSSRTLSESLT